MANYEPLDLSIRTDQEIRDMLLVLHRKYDMLFVNHERLQFAVKVYKNREKETEALNRTGYKKLAEEYQEQIRKEVAIEKVRILGLIEDFGCSCIRGSFADPGDHAERCPFRMAQKIRKLSDD